MSIIYPIEYMCEDSPTPAFYVKCNAMRACISEGNFHDDLRRLSFANQVTMLMINSPAAPPSTAQIRDVFTEDNLRYIMSKTYPGLWHKQVDWAFFERPPLFMANVASQHGAQTITLPGSLPPGYSVSIQFNLDEPVKPQKCQHPQAIFIRMALMCPKCGMVGGI